MITECEALFDNVRSSNPVPYSTRSRLRLPLQLDKAAISVAAIAFVAKLKK